MNKKLKQASAVNANNAEVIKNRATKKASVRSYDPLTGQFIVNSGGVEKVAPLLSNGNAGIGEVLPSKGTAIDAQHHTPPKKERTNLPAIVGNPTIYYTRYLMSETIAGSTRIILNGTNFTEPKIIHSIPEEVPGCPPEDGGQGGYQCRIAPVSLAYIFKSDREQATNNLTFSDFFWMIVIQGSCIPRIRFGPRPFDSFDVDGNLRPPTRTAYIERSSIGLTRWNSDNGTIIYSPGDDNAGRTQWITFGSNHSGQIGYPTATLSTDLRTFWPSQTWDENGPDEFVARILWSQKDVSLFQVRNALTGEVLDPAEYGEDLDTPDIPPRRNQIATAMTLRKGKTYINVAQGESCDPLDVNYQETLSWIVDFDGNFLDQNGNVAPDGTPTIIEPEVLSELFRQEYFTSLKTPDLDPQKPPCYQALRANLATFADEVDFSKSITSKVLGGAVSEQDMPETRLAPKYNEPNPTNGIRFDDPARVMLGASFSVMAETFVDTADPAAPNGCESESIIAKVISVPGLNYASGVLDVSEEQAEAAGDDNSGGEFQEDDGAAPWPHNGWGFHWLLTGTVRKKDLKAQSQTPSQ